MRRGLHELDSIVVVARHRNFRAAAAELGLSRSALSHAVTALEARLGVRLFNRSTRSVSLTEAGAELVDAVAPALNDLRLAIEKVGARRAKPAGTLRINASAGAARQMMPLLLDFVRRYPDMKVDLVTEGRLIDIVAGGFDAGVRIAEAVPRDMIAVPLGPCQQPMVIGAPAYFAEHGQPRSPHELIRHRCIRARMASGVIWRWEFESQGEALTVDVQGPLTFDDTTLMIDAALAGVGLAYLTDTRVVDHLACGRLVRVLTDWTPSYPGLCLYYSGRRHLPVGVRALVDLVKSQSLTCNAT